MAVMLWLPGNKHRMCRKFHQNRKTLVVSMILSKKTFRPPIDPPRLSRGRYGRVPDMGHDRLLKNFFVTDPRPCAR
jgi:hypothetical protein